MRQDFDKKVVGEYEVGERRELINSSVQGLKCGTAMQIKQIYRLDHRDIRKKEKERKTFLISCSIHPSLLSHEILT